jgi:hypothetical protein
MTSRTLRIAFRLVRIAALEDRVQLLARKYPGVTEQSIRKLAELDPTGGKYVEWLVRRFMKGDPVFALSDYIRGGLGMIAKISKSKPLMEYYGFDGNLNKWQAGDLAVFYNNHRDDDLSSKTQQLKDAKKLGTTVLYDKGGYKVIKIGGNGDDRLGYAVDAACVYARGTKWCTSDKNMSRKYLKKGPLFIIIKNGHKVLQTDLQSFMDAEDKGVDLSKNRDLLRVLVESGVIESPEDALRIISRNINYGYGERWPELEPLFARDPKTAVEYARFTGQRFPLGEKAIASVPEYAYFYVITVLKDRFPQAEATLRKDPEYWSYYESWINHLKEQGKLGREVG